VLRSAVGPALPAVELFVQFALNPA
jgi:hypothetical protein